jgi:hypothetical protein
MIMRFAVWAGAGPTADDEQKSRRHRAGGFFGDEGDYASRRQPAWLKNQ